MNSLFAFVSDLTSTQLAGQASNERHMSNIQLQICLWNHLRQHDKVVSSNYPGNCTKDKPPTMISKEQITCLSMARETEHRA